MRPVASGRKSEQVALFLPRFRGVDHSGKPFHLSDYHGKPFALIGVITNGYQAGGRLSIAEGTVAVSELVGS
jgi:hypothetical protein